MFDYREYYGKLNELLLMGEAIWQAIVINSDGSTPAKAGMHLAIPLTSPPIGNLGGGNLEYIVINMIRKEQPKKAQHLRFNLDEQGQPLDEESIGTGMICGGMVEIYIEPLFYPSRLFIIGGGHCGRALAHLASLVNFRVTVIDNRQDLLLKENYPEDCRLLYNDYSDPGAVIDFDDSAFIVIMTHGHIHDKQVLEYCLKKPFYYLGMIGSQKKVTETFTRLLNQGFSEEDLKRVKAPVGISIGSQTPYEIAVSITAELIRERNLQQ